MRIIAKVGTSSLTDERGVIDRTMIASLCEQISELRTRGHDVVLVTSAAVAAGVAALGLDRRPTDLQTLQALAAVGQSRLMEVYNAEFARQGLVAAQVLLVPHDFVDRRQYLHARETMETLLSLGCVPVVNENDAIANDQIRFGDNDHIAALLSHLMKADILILLTDTDGLHTADPRRDPSARLVHEVFVGDPLLSVEAGASGTNRGSGGMGSKLSAARIASWSGIRAVIAPARLDSVLPRVVDDVANSSATVGTTFHGADRHLSARQLWVAFASEVCGRIWVDDGAREALRRGTVSLLPAGVRRAEGDFEVGDTVEILDGSDHVIARGSSSMSDRQVERTAGLRTHQLDEGLPTIVVHRDSLVILPH
ncbi:MAG: glutamate 5-kinase [Ilumatobacteraceae bacterium]